MNGAESLVHTLLASGVDTCFSNPGTSEMHFVAALDHIPGMRSVLTLQEGVATGAADGYYRMAGKTACTLLHLGPGLANGLSNLHNAKKAGSGVLNIIGEHAESHIALDA
ncbi:MAG: thiamine pyrophosphate-binding protein, partial [Paracoccaceae bacterium]